MSERGRTRGWLSPRRQTWGKVLPMFHNLHQRLGKDLGNIDVGLVVESFELIQL